MGPSLEEFIDLLWKVHIAGLGTYGALYDGDIFVIPGESFSA